MVRQRKKINNSKGLMRKLSVIFDGLVGIVSPEAMARRGIARFSYDAATAKRTHKSRTGQGGSGDKQLTTMTLGKLREIARDLSRNNAVALGLLQTQRDGIVGSGARVKSDTGDDGLNKEMDLAWKEEVIQSPIDITGRFNFNDCQRIGYLTYLRDGDYATILTDDGIQNIEGEQIGTPASLSGSGSKLYEVRNGVAVSKQTGRVVGYYIGQPDKWGWIRGDSYRMYNSDDVHHMFSTDRFSQSRGAPVLTSAIEYIDLLDEYFEAEAVAAKVQACFSMFVSRRDEYEDGEFLPTAYDYPSGFDENGNRIEKMEPGTIIYGKDGESASGIGMNRPGAMFTPFINGLLMLISRPLTLPLILVTGDFSGATFMNIRVAYQQAQERWKPEQNSTLLPYARKIRMWKVQQWIDSGKFKFQEGIFGHTIWPRRWPYVDPFKEAKADEVELRNGTTSQTEICERKGLEFEKVVVQAGIDNKARIDNSLLKEVESTTDAK